MSNWAPFRSVVDVVETLIRMLRVNGYNPASVDMKGGCRVVWVEGDPMVCYSNKIYFQGAAYSVIDDKEIWSFVKAHYPPTITHTLRELQLL